jgi:enamine deaminase RidA (YjgF/YER057c/UK114 family)
MTAPAGEAEQRLAALGITLPPAQAPAAAYVPVVRSGALLYTAGQVARGPDGMVAEGVVGEGGVDIDTAIACARTCAINVLALLKAELGDLGRVNRVVKLTVFVAGVPGFTQAHVVANGASELINEVLGARGAHARSAVAVAGLPLGSPVEVEAVVEVG